MWTRPHQIARKKTRHFLVRLNAESLEDRSVPDATYHNLAAGDFSQDWSTTASLLTTNDDWSGVPSIIGYLGDGTGAGSNGSTNPWDVTADSTSVDLVPNSTTTTTAGGVHEIEAAQTIALQGSGSARSPYIQIHLNATGRQNLQISYTLKELDSDNANQKFALQYRVGTTGPWTDIADGHISSTFNAGGMQSTPLSNIRLPSAVNNQAQVQVRIITADASGPDSMVGIDDIVVTSEALPNAPPVVTTSSGTTNYTEDDAATAVDAAITVTDADSTNLTGATVQITGGYINGQDKLAFSNTASISGSFDASTGKLTLSGTDSVAHYQDALRAVTYVNTSENPGTGNRTVTFVATDGIANSIAKTKTITVTAVNDAPAGADATVTTNEDVPYTFTAEDFGFSDAIDNSANNFFAVKIATLPTAGTLKNGTNPVNAGDFVSVHDINLGKLTFTPAPDANGTGYATFTFQVQDDGGTANSGIDLDPSPNTITINVNAVNDPPTLTDPVDTSATVGLPKTVTLTGISAGGGETQELTVTATSDKPGTVPNPSVSYTSANSTGMLTFTPLATGSAIITVRVTDDNGTPGNPTDDAFIEQQFTVNVSANQAPVNTVPTSLTTDEDTALAFTGANTISVTDPDSTPGNITTVVSVPANRGTLTATGASGNGTNSITITGDASTVNAALATLVYAPPLNENSTTFGGSVTLTVDTTDASGGNDHDTGAITVTPVNDRPSFTANNPSAVNEDDGAITVSGFATFSPGGSTDEVAQTPTYSVSNVSNPGLFLSGPSIDTSGTLTYTLNPNVSGSSMFDVTVQDSGGTVNGGINTSQSQTFTITVNAVNDAPSGTDKTVTTNEDTDYAFTAGDFGFTDLNDSPANSLLAVKITTLPTIGTLIHDGTAVTAGQVISVADINAGKFTFTPGTNENGTAYASFTFQVQDNGGTSNHGVDLDPSANTITMDVTPVNDKPGVTLAGDLVVDQDTGVFNQNGFATFSPGGGADEVNQTPTYLLTNTNNALFSGQPMIDANGKLNFTLAPGMSGTAIVTVNASDSGPGTAPNDNIATPVQFTITVNAVVAAPPVAAQPVSIAASSPATSGARYIAIGSDAGSPSRVRILSATTGAVLADFSPFGAYSGGVRVAVGDITGDGTDDIVIASAGTVGMLEVIDGRTGAVMGPIMPFGSFPSGLEIALGDIDGDGRMDLVLAVERGASTVGTFAFSGRTGQLLRAFNAFPGFDGGIQLAVGDVNGDHKAEIVVAAASGMNGAIAVYDGATGNLLSTFPSHPGYPGEVNVAVGDLDGDGKDEIITTAQSGTYGTQIEVFNEQGQIVKNLFAPTSIGVTLGFERSASVAVVANQTARVSAADINHDGIADLLLADPPGTGSSKLLVLDGKTGAVIQNPFAFDPLFGFGVFVDAN